MPKVYTQGLTRADRLTVYFFLITLGVSRDHHPNKSAKANRGRPSCSLSQMQKLCNATLAAKRARNPLSS